MTALPDSELAAHNACVLQASDTTVKVGENIAMKRRAWLMMQLNLLSILLSRPD